MSQTRERERGGKREREINWEGEREGERGVQKGREIYLNVRKCERERNNETQRVRENELDMRLS
jgi:hypothetical protein